MIIFMEGDLQITFYGALNARRFDGSEHGLSHCMKAVDFVVELPDKYLFMELKDPQHPEGNQEDQERFMQDFRKGRLDGDLKYKYRDSFLYEWASGRADKPVHYYVLVASDELKGADLQHRTRQLARILPVDRPGSWIKPIAAACYVFNLRLWNQHLPEFPITRLSA